MAVNLAKFSLIDSSYERYFHLMDVEIGPGEYFFVDHSAGEFIPIVLISSDGEDWIDIDDISRNEQTVTVRVGIDEVMFDNFTDKKYKVRILGIEV